LQYRELVTELVIASVGVTMSASVTEYDRMMNDMVVDTDPRTNLQQG
jgi:hypothetical protein